MNENEIFQRSQPTSTIFVAQIRKSPYVSKANREANQSQEEVDFARPCFPLPQDHVRFSYPALTWYRNTLYFSVQHAYNVGLFGSLQRSMETRPSRCHSSQLGKGLLKKLYAEVIHDFSQKIPAGSLSENKIHS